MKTLIINTLYYPNLVGGAERSVQLDAEELVKEGGKVYVVSLGAASEVRRINGVVCIYNGLFYRLSPYCNWGAAWKKIVWHVLDVFNPVQFFVLFFLIRRIRPDVLHTNNVGGFSVSVWLASRLCGVRVVHTLRDYHLTCLRCTRYRNGSVCEKSCMPCSVVGAARRFSSRWVDEVVGISEYILNKHTALGYFKNTDFKRVRHNLVKIPSNLVSKPRVGSGVVFGFVGQLMEEKGLVDLIRSFRLLDGDVQLDIFGRASDESLLDILKREAVGCRVTFKGVYPIEKIFQSIDVLCVPSRWEEPFGRVIIEANAFNVPVICSGLGGMPEIASAKDYNIVVRDGNWRGAMEYFVRCRSR
ncbi:glycosyltransferase family 4 protein [Pelagicoccus albus]|uniref:Glycosyltransferase family 4 protein n=1 Tax=Pelagicoccus albus TaxID=415222 RepID=A0A7X1E8F1_9BACT|nr:glycosyltransferase family 4 protein [Pelagicoccus albus]MBC2606289.1 glycosyltransferase family 4 protein [Pelagicoccus albus]